MSGIHEWHFGILETQLPITFGAAVKPAISERGYGCMYNGC